MTKAHEHRSLHDKKQLRLRLRALRSTFGAEEHARRSDAIIANLQSLPEIQSAGCVHVFWPMIDRFEVDTRALIAWLYTHKKQIVLPVVVEAPGGAGGESLEHRLYTGEDALVRSRWGVREPRDAELVPAEAIDVVVVPALGVDKHGNRLGYGRGYYDRFLRHVSVPTVCPIYQDCVVDRIPAESHDVPVSLIVTESGVLRTSPT